MVSRFPIIHLRGTIPLVAPPRIIGYPVARHRITGFLVPNKVIYAGLVEGTAKLACKIKLGGVCLKNFSKHRL